MTSDLKRRFLAFIRDEHLFNKDDRILLAVSGGVDSMVLLHLMLKSGMRFQVAHVNYNLRSKASKKDAEFVKQFCKKYLIPFHTKDVREKPNSNLQEWARKIRYNYFHEIISNEGLDYILTAHHFDDQLETLILNLTRGSGISGLAGIPIRNEKILRPLLFARKNEILLYAKANKIEWREDTSNVSSKYNRNIVRNEIIPVLDRIRDNDKGLKKSMEHLKSMHSWITNYFSEQIQHQLTNEGEWEFKLPEQIQRHHFFQFYELLSPFNFNGDQTEEILKSGRTGAIFESQSHIATIDRNVIRVRKILEKELIVEKIETTAKPVSISTGSKTIEFSEVSTSEFVMSKTCIFFDTQLLNRPLHIRRWEIGDRFQPYGMYGKSKKVSDLLVHLKLSHFEKEDTLLLLDDDQTILWVIGYRRSIHAPVGESSQRLLKVEIRSD